MNMEPEAAAEQLTFLTFKKFEKIQPSELMGQVWSKDWNQAPNVIAMTDDFNQVSGWVATQIVKEKTLRLRTKLLNKLIHIAVALRKLNNYHLLIAFISGLKCGPVDRLKWTNARLNKNRKKELNELEVLMSLQGSFKNYRQALNYSDRAIPYLGVVLQDITFTEDGCPDKVGALINFHKRMLIHRILKNFLHFQSSVYTSPDNPSLEKFFSDLPFISEAQLYQESLLREPKNATRSDIES